MKIIITFIILTFLVGSCAIVKIGDNTLELFKQNKTLKDKVKK